MEVVEKISLLLLGIFIGYTMACILRAAKEADERIKNKPIEQLEMPVPNTYFRTRVIADLRKKVKETELKAAFYITIINQIEEELKKQQFNSVINLTNKIKSIIYQSYEDVFNKRKELINDDRNEND